MSACVPHSLGLCINVMGNCALISLSESILPSADSHCTGDDDVDDVESCVCLDSVLIHVYFMHSPSLGLDLCSTNNCNTTEPLNAK